MVDTLIAGLIHGNAYALVAVGLSLIFGVTNVVNFAHGSVFALGSMIGWWVLGPLGWPLGWGIAAVVVLTGLLGWGINVVAVRPLAKVSPIAALLATVAVSLILDNLSQFAFGPQTRPFPEVLPTNNIQWAGVRLGTSDVVMFLVTVVSMALLAVYLKFGRTGRAIRATAQDPEAASQMGIPVPLIQNLSFIIASALGGLAGVFVGLYTSSISPTSGATAGLTAFVAATLGGLGSIPGAVVGGFLMGVIEAFGISIFDDKFRDIITFGVLILVLLFRPGGLFGRVPVVTTEPLTGTFLGQGRPRTIPIWAVWAILAVAVGLPVVANGYTLVVGTQVLIYAVIGVALTVLSGSAGQVTLGQAGPVAIGAYASAILVKFLGWPFLLALPAAGLLSAVIASALTAPLWRLKGHYVSVATLGMGVVIVAIIRNWEGLTRGAYGITAIPPPDLFGWKLATPTSYYLIDLAVLALTLLVITRLRRSHLGKVISAVGSDEVAAGASGVSGRNYKALAFAVAAFFAGVAGSLMAHQYSYLEPSVFDLTMALLALTVIVLGGVNSPFGAVLGSLILVGLPELLRIAPSVRIVGYGVLLLLAIRFRPQGLWMVRT